MSPKLEACLAKVRENMKPDVEKTLAYLRASRDYKFAHLETVLRLHALRATMGAEEGAEVDAQIVNGIPFLEFAISELERKR